MKTSRPSRLGYSIGDEPVPGYRLVQFLGEGGFGEVWQVTAPGGTPAALKIVDLGTRQGQKEFRALAAVKQLQHPNLVPISAFWLKDSNGRVLEQADVEAVAAEGLRPPSRSAISETLVVPRYAPPLELIIAMGLGEKSLQQRLAECKEQSLPGIPPAELLRYMEDAARAIDHLVSPGNRHGTALGGMQHGDIKPLNILIVGDAAQVCDFGLARVLTDNRKTAEAFSPPYVAPEVIEQKDPSAAADQYALAVSYVELRTGELPFREGCDGFEILEAHKSGTLNLSRLEQAERAVIARATARDPAARFPSAGAMVRALREAVEPMLPDQQPAPRRLSVATVAAFAAVLLVSVGVAAYQWNRSAAEQSGRAGPPPPLDADIKLLEPAQVVIRAGEPTVREAAVFQRTGCDGPIQLEWQGPLPKGVRSELPEIPRGKESAKLVFTADVGADVGSTDLVLLAWAGEIRREFTIELTVGPPNLGLPEGFVVDEPSSFKKSNTGPWRAEKIVCTRHALHVRFMLVPQGEPGEYADPENPADFYIMEDKVSNASFGQFAKDNQRQLPADADKPGEGRLPVVRVTWYEAEDFAKWLGGHLPTEKQWDKAAGRFEAQQREGPYRGRWDSDPRPAVAVNRSGPCSMDEHTDDVSPFGCRHMSGNGKEWTFTGGVEGFRRLRGRSFREERPLTFAELDPER
ncbi:MAG TPA: bifunctional serine/threonine-protein kinase/formylglycine-generating enzyme family protein, partial [Pirellulales bacterium]|nr:bifunctional serine/threonine-protein kinase/formylglycine-generating enzyme family protein [Pirellulales bacterium]